MSQAVSIVSAPKGPSNLPHRGQEVLGNRFLVPLIVRQLPPEKGYACVNRAFRAAQGQVMAERILTTPPGRITPQRESLDLRIKKVFGEERAPEKMARLYQKLHRSQLDLAYFDGHGLRRFREATQRHQAVGTCGSYSYERFLELEEYLDVGKIQRHERRKDFARTVLHTIPEWWKLDLHAPTSEQEFLDFFNNPAHQEAFANITSLSVDQIMLRDSELIDMLKKLPSLRSLTITRDNNCSPLREFPQELTALSQLRFLWIEGQAFSKIPDEATQFPELLILDLYKNSEQIKELPEAFTRHYLGGWASLAFEPVRELIPLIAIFMRCADAREDFISDLVAYENYHTASLNPTQFERIPYHLWFREHFSIPYIPSLLIAPIVMALTAPIQAINQLIKGCLGGDDRAQAFAAAISVVLFTLVFIPSTLLMIVLNLPIFVLNVIINRVIEPIVSWVRESCCGYDPMIEQ